MSRQQVLVDADWVEAHLNDPNVVVVEVDEDTSAYDKGHIRNAVKLDWKKDLQDPVRRDFVDKAAFERLMSERGISNDHTVVLYGGNNNWFAAYAFWQLKYYGHNDARLMNGGRKKWIAENRPLVTETPKVAPATYRATGPDESIRAHKEEVALISDRKKPGHLVDVRSPDEFTGKIIAPPGMTETAQRAGHIPGAANVPWSQAAREDGTFKSVEELKQLYQGKGITGDGEVIAYCRIGERSSHTWFVLKYLLGYENVKNYDGSWTEWGNLIGAPIEKDLAAAAR